MILPFGQLLDLISIMQIRDGVMVEKKSAEEELADFQRLLSFR